MVFSWQSALSISHKNQESKTTKEEAEQRGTDFEEEAQNRFSLFHSSLDPFCFSN
jgi:hypothetical protein